MKLGLSQKLPFLAPALSAPAHPPSCSLFSSLQASPSAPSPGGPEFWERKPGAGPQTDADFGLQLELQPEVVEAVEGGEDWPGEGREDRGHGGTRRAPRLPVPMEASVLCFTGPFLSSGLLSSLCWVLWSESALSKTQGGFVPPWQVAITSCLWVMEGRSAVSSQPQAPESQGCFFLPAPFPFL